MILITTPDYLPKIGGLTTLTLDLEKSLKAMEIPCEVFQWNSWQDIQRFPKEKLASYSMVINIHYLFGFIRRKDIKQKMLNFVCGTEILFSSPTWWKKIVKKMGRKLVVSHLEKAYLNLFISDFTYELLQSFGYQTSSSRDVVYHCGIDISKEQFNAHKNFIQDDVIKFACIARDVKHKNLQGAVEFCEFAAKAINKKVELILPFGTKYQSDKIKIRQLETKSDDEKMDAFRVSHFNLLLSLPAYREGFVEGFGLTVLEAGLFGTPSIVMRTGGLVDSVHENFTGWVIDKVEATTVHKLFQHKINNNYDQVARLCYEHTVHSHDLKVWRKIFEHQKFDLGAVV